MLCKRYKAPVILAAMALSACMSQKIPLPHGPLINIQGPEPLLRPVTPSSAQSRKDVTRALLRAIKFGNDDEQLHAAKRLKEIADDSVAIILLDELQGRHPETQLHCAIALANIRNARAVPIIIDLVEHKHPYDFDLFVILGDFKDPRAIPLMEKKLESDDLAYRAVAAEALGKARSVSSTAKLIRLLKDPEPTVKTRAIRALGVLQAQDASYQILLAIEDKTDYVRASAIEALGEIGEPAIPILFDAILFGNPDNRHSYMDSLIAMGTKATPSLIEALKYPDSIMRSYAVRSLGNIGDQSATPALFKALEDNDTVVRGDAANALRMMNVYSATPKLAELARNDPSEYVRAASEAAIRSISGK
ncbi:MAG: HEAT repeat domain-containing protein [Candidatus Micrarchaeota archaeon]